MSFATDQSAGGSTTQHALRGRRAKGSRHCFHRDSIANRLNIAAYVRADPINFVDPLGLNGFCTVTNYGWYHGSTGEYVGPAGVEISGCTSTGPFYEEARGVPLGGSPGRQVTIKLPPSKPPIPCIPTLNQLINSGEVTYQFTEGMITRGLFSSHLEGTFVTSKGYSGRFETFASGVFIGGGYGVAEGFGRSESLATFSGTNYNVVGSLGPIAISDNFSTGFSHVGQTDAASTPGLGFGGTVSETQLKDVRCPPIASLDSSTTPG